MSGQDKQLPMEKLRQALTQAEAPLVNAILGNTEAVKRTNALLERVLEVATGARVANDEAPPPEEMRERARAVASDPTPAELDAALDEMRGKKKQSTPANDFDMESAIKLSGQWECKDLVCSNCPVDQNLDCLETYGFLDLAEKAMGKTDGSDESARLALHAMVRDAVTPKNGKPAAEKGQAFADGSFVPLSRLKPEVVKPHLAVPPVPKPAVVVPKEAAKPAAKKQAAKKPRPNKPLKASIADRQKHKAKAKGKGKRK